MTAEFTAVPSRVAVKARAERLLAAQGRDDAVGEPLARLEGPAAADTEEGVGRQGGIADEGEPGATGALV